MFAVAAFGFFFLDLVCFLASACDAVPVPCYVFATTAATAADFFRQLLSEHWMLVM